MARAPQHKKLFEACAGQPSDLQALLALIDAGADPTRRYQASVGPGRDDIDALYRHLLDGSGDPAVLALLIDAGADPVRATPRYGLTPLHAAAQRGLTKAVSFLLQGGAPVDVLDKGSSTALHYAAERDAVEVVRVLLAAGANPRRSHWRISPAATPVAIAASVGAIASLEVLLSSGVDPNWPGLGAPPIHCATESRAMVCLARHGADLDVAYRDNTALMAAASSNQVERVDGLLDAGARIDAMAAGRSPLHVAVQAQHPQMVRLLVGRAADPNLGADGRTALELARETNPLIACLLGENTGVPRERPATLVRLLLAQKSELRFGDEGFEFLGGDSFGHRHPAFETPGWHAVSVGWAAERCAWLLCFGGKRAAALEAALSEVLRDLGCEPYRVGEAVILLRDNEAALVELVTDEPTPAQVGDVVTQFLLDGGKFERGGREGYSGCEGRDGSIRHYDGYPGMTREEESEWWESAAAYSKGIRRNFRVVDGLVVSDPRHAQLLRSALVKSGRDSVRSWLRDPPVGSARSNTPL